MGTSIRARLRPCDLLAELHYKDGNLCGQPGKALKQKSPYKHLAYKDFNKQ
jgi:hypothetical protein